MANINLRELRWLIETLIEAGEDGMNIRNLNYHYNKDRETENRERKMSGLPSIPERLKHHFEAIKHNTLHYWRSKIYVLFGIVIESPNNDGVYIIKNPEVWEEQKTLKQIVTIMIEENKRSYQAGALPKQKRGRKPKALLTGFMSRFSNDYFDDYYEDSEEKEDIFGYVDQSLPEMVDMIRFSMTMGESLIIKYSKTLNGSSGALRKISFVFEPQKLKEINGRWYVGGNIYPYGKRDKVIPTTFDVEQIKLADLEDGILVPRYELNEAFDMYAVLPEGWNELFNPNKVVSMYVRAAWNIFENKPFCQSQEKLDGGTEGLSDKYKLFVLPNEDFMLQYFSYGDEVSAFSPRNEENKTELDISKDQVSWLLRAKNAMTFKVIESLEGELSYPIIGRIMGRKKL